ncbi:MAG: hypothetical protein DHS20C15_08540 [Planctomycetota bacterium]|nr:MAG: hypothetical protein DHS20C15_08540 [Planctomycetota bacterium]
MKALLLADQELPELAPLSERTAPALLPVLGKPLVVHAVESLVAAGITEIVISVSPHARLVEQELGDGTRFGARFQFQLTRGDGDFRRLAGRLSQLGDDYLVVDAMVLRSAFIDSFLESCAEHPGVSLRATADGTPCGVWRMDNSDAERFTDVEVADAVARPIAGLRAFHTANMEALAGRFPGLLMRGSERSPKLRACRHARVRPREVLTGSAFVGRGSTVKPSAELHGPVVLGDHVIVDEQAILRDTVVLQDTYVGPHVELDHAIVWKSYLIRVDTGAVAVVTDPTLLADLAGESVSAVVRLGFDRLVALALIVLAAPLWIWMALDSWRVAPQRPFPRRSLLGNRVTRTVDGQSRREPFSVIEGATHIPVLRRLPWLLAVLKGELALVGVQPLAPDEAGAHAEEWQRVREGAPVGLIAPGEPNDPNSGEEQALLEALYAETRSLGTDLRCVARAARGLLSPSAWKLPIRF